MNENALQRRDFILLGAVWAVLAAMLIWVNWRAIMLFDMPDADDFLRLQQIRDWMAGQSWFDVTQHRINPPIGGVMHWSRLIDVPMAAAIALLSPLFGRAQSEVIVATAEPMLVLGFAMLIVGAIAARLVGRRWAPVAAAFVPLSGLIYTQIMPLRIDHHGVQMVVALTILWALLDEQRKIRSGAIAGAAAALWLNISIEALPMAFAVAALLGVRWLLDPSEWRRLCAYLWTLTLASVCLETITSLDAWTHAECDRMSAPYTLVFFAAALAASASAAPLMRRDIRLRLGLGGVAALGAGAAFLWSGPSCVHGPFSALEPVVRTYWLDNVGESKPLIGLGLGRFIAHLGYAAIGWAGAVMALRATQGQTRLQWITMLALMLASGALMLVLTRAGAVAHAFATPGAVYAASRLIAWARAIRLTLLRAVTTAFALIFASPVFALTAIAIDPRVKPIPTAPILCTSAVNLAPLQRIHSGVVFTPLDIGPAILVRTPLSVVATGHHRNHAAMADVIESFIGTPDRAHRLVSAHHADYLALCPPASEVEVYTEAAPNGFAAQLLAGETPAWLEPIKNAAPDSGLLLYRVRETR